MSLRGDKRGNENDLLINFNGMNCIERQAESSVVSTDGEFKLEGFKFIFLLHLSLYWKHRVTCEMGEYFFSVFLVILYVYTMME